MDGELTVGAVFEDISERVALGRSRALMGEREEALNVLQRARLDYMRFQEVLDDYPGSLSLRRSLETALAALCDERSEENTEPATGAGPAPSNGRSDRSPVNVQSSELLRSVA